MVDADTSADVCAHTKMNFSTSGKPAAPPHRRDSSHSRYTLALSSHIPSSTAGILAMATTESQSSESPAAVSRGGRPDDLFAPSKLTSWVWQHFLKSKSDSEHAWCNVSGCPPSLQKVKRKGSNTTNLSDHLRNRHSIRASSAAASGSTRSIRDSLLAASKDVAPCSASFKAALDEHITHFFISNCLAFNVADSASYVSTFHFATGRTYFPPARTKLITTSDALFDVMGDALLADVKDNTISITSDAATLDNGQSYITITAHYITNTMLMRDVTLFVSRLTGSHTGEYVSDLLDHTIAAWEADDRCFAAVTDNGANFVKATRLASKVQDGLRCACHTLQLALKDGVAKQPVLKQLCADAQHVVVTIRRSALLTEELQDVQCLEDAAAVVQSAADAAGEEKDPVRPLRLAMNVPTRFNSLCILFSRLLEVKVAVQRVCINRAALFEGTVLSSDQWEQIAELLTVLTPVKELCDALETSATPSLSFLIPLTSQLIHVLTEQYGKLSIPSCRTVCEKVRGCVYQRMTDALCDSTYQIAMMLDPRVRTKDIMNYNKELAVKALRDAFIDFPSTLAKFRGAQAVSLRHGENQTDEVVVESAPKRAKLTLQLNEENAPAAETQSELDLYLREGGIPLHGCPLLWWRERKDRYPVLFEMARVYLAVPASSAPSERVFSAAKLVLNDKRKQLLEGRLARLIFMKRNMVLYNELKSNNTKKSK